MPVVRDASAAGIAIYFLETDIDIRCFNHLPFYSRNLPRSRVF